MRHRAISLVLCTAGCCLIMSACQHSQKQDISSPGGSSQETPQDVGKALQSITGNLTGKEMSEEDLRELSRQIQKDEEAKSAVEAVTTAVGGGVVSAKYCPVDGKHFSADMKTCPAHKVELVPIED